MFSLSQQQWTSLSKMNFWLDDIIGCDKDGNHISPLNCMDDFIPLFPLE
jgi:hypothetical protein